MDKGIEFGLYQSCGSRVSVGCVFGLQWGVGRGLGPESRGVGWRYVCVSCESEFSVWMGGPGICILCLTDTCTS